MSLTTLNRVQKLQAALHDKVEKSPDFRFYVLYDKVYRKDVLRFAYESCKANGGAALPHSEARLRLSQGALSWRREELHWYLAVFSLVNLYQHSKRPPETPNIAT
jgi:hypothetical protein